MDPTRKKPDLGSIINSSHRQIPLNNVRILLGSFFFLKKWHSHCQVWLEESTDCYWEVGNHANVFHATTIWKVIIQERDTRKSHDCARNSCEDPSWLLGRWVAGSQSVKGHYKDGAGEKDWAYSSCRGPWRGIRRGHGEDTLRASHGWMATRYSAREGNPFYELFIYSRRRHGYPHVSNRIS